jgi:23S rRNA (guanosine2251-2'-O)-methyltransferase
MIIYGKNPVNEILADPHSGVDEVMVNKDAKSDNASKIVKLAKSRGVKVSFLPREALTRLAGTTSHQGVLAKIREFTYSDISHILQQARSKGENLLIVILDHLEDPQNLGAIIRTADFLGAHGVVIPKDRAAAVTPSVIKASSGAVNHVPLARVVNLARVIKDLKKDGVWIVGADAVSSQSVYEQDFKGLDIALVIGGEGRGLSKSVKDSCDFLVSIPKLGKVSSLNASVAAGMMLYEMVRQRAAVNKT